jgi:hypothetical protein
MARIRFSISSLLGLVLFVAIAAAALRAASDLWDSGLLSATVALLVAAVLFALHRTGKRRAFWIGLCVFGWAYIGASLIPPVEARLATTKLLAYLESKRPAPAENATVLHLTLDSFAIVATTTPTSVEDANNGKGIIRDTDSSTVAATGGRWFGYPYMRNYLAWNTWSALSASGTSENFVRIGHSLICLILAFAGGHVSRFLYGRAAA